MNRYILFILVLFIFFYGCTKKTDVKTSQYGVIIRGWVFNVETGNPVANTRVTLISDRDTLTLNAPKGRFSFDVKPGMYRLKAAKKGFITEEEQLDISKKKIYEYDFILKKGRKLTPKEKEAQEHLMIGVSAFNEGDLKKAKSELVIAYSLDPNNSMINEYFSKVNEAISFLVDSLYREALSLESKKKNSDAAKIYKNILSYEPNNKNAKDRLDAINIMLIAKPKPKPKPAPKPAAKPTVNIENIYKQGLSLFSQGKYKSAISKFNTVLKYKPNHSGAKTYLKKAKTRLKALEG